MDLDIMQYRFPVVRHRICNTMLVSYTIDISVLFMAIKQTTM